KCAAHAVERLFGNEIANGPFHHAPSGRGAEENQLFRAKKRLQLRLDFRVEVFEALPTMADHRRTKRAESLLADFDRPRNVQFHVSHDFRKAFNRSLVESLTATTLDSSSRNRPQDFSQGMSESKSSFGVVLRSRTFPVRSGSVGGWIPDCSQWLEAYHVPGRLGLPGSGWPSAIRLS